MRVGRCAMLGDEAEGNRCDAPDDPEGHPEGVVKEEGLATMEWHRIGVREAGPWTRAPVSQDSPPQRGSPMSARGNAPGSRAHQRHEP